MNIYMSLSQPIVISGISGSADSDPLSLTTLSTRLQLPIVSLASVEKQQMPYLLYLNHDRLELRSTQSKQQNTIYIDFLEGKTRHRRLYGGGKGQSIAKAIGIKKIPNARVIDATAGLGGDAFVLASLGCDVTLLERNPVIYSLLENALQRVACSDDLEVKKICSRMTLINQNASDYLGAQKKSDYADVIYLDPMFPSRKKSAKVKKEMSYFHDIVGTDDDSDLLLFIALKCARKRIVVKRPRLAKPLAALNAHFIIAGKSTRYDVYLPQL